MTRKRSQVQVLYGPPVQWQFFVEYAVRNGGYCNHYCNLQSLSRSQVASQPMPLDAAIFLAF